MRKMKKLVPILIFLLSLPVVAQASQVYAPKNAKLYEVGKDIVSGSYSLELDKNDRLNLSIVTVGNDLMYTPGRDSILIKNGDYKEYKIDKDTRSMSLDLVEGNKLFVNAGSPRLILLDDSINIKNVTVPATPIPVQGRLSSDEIKKITSSVPYVSSKNITIDSPDGVDFYTYFGSGIIMSGASGDCFKIIDCDDELIVDHYKLMPVNPGKGKIEYVINMKKKIVVNVTVKDSAFSSSTPSDPSEASVVKAIKSVNIRAEASTSSRKVGSIKKGVTLPLIQAYCSDDWHLVEYNGKPCYVSAQYVDLQ